MAKRYSGVRHIRGNIYEINYYLSSQSKREQYRIEAKSEKEAFLIRVQHIAKHEPNTDAQSLSFPELKERLVLKCQADGNSKKTIKNLISKFHNFFKVFLPKHYSYITSINQLTDKAIEAYKQFVVVDQNRTTGWRDEITKLRTIVSKLVKIGCCNKEVYDGALCGVKKPKRTMKLYKEISKAQMKKLLEHIKKHRPDYYGITYMIMRLGWRRSQVISIKRKNVKLNGLRPVAIICEPQDTKNKEPFILRDIDDELAKIIKQCYFNKRKTEWLFPNKNNDKHHANHYTGYIAKTSQKLLGIRLTPHDFRHSFCTKMKAEGHADRDIMAITGHKDIESFHIYTHATSAGTKQVLDRSRLF